MSQATVKPKKLWGNPKVFMSPTDLIVEERYYPIAHTLGAYVEPVPVEAKPAEPAKFDTRPPYMKILTGIWYAIIIIFVIVFISWWNDGYSSSGSGSNTKHRLVLVSESGPIVALEHTNVKKLKDIAGQVNQTLVSRGISPQTATY